MLLLLTNVTIMGRTKKKIDPIQPAEKPKPTLTEWLDKHEIWHKVIPGNKVQFRLYGDAYAYHLDEGRCYCYRTRSFEIVELKEFVGRLFTERAAFKQKHAISSYWTKSEK